MMVASLIALGALLAAAPGAATAKPIKGKPRIASLEGFYYRAGDGGERRVNALVVSRYRRVRAYTFHPRIRERLRFRAEANLKVVKDGKRIAGARDSGGLPVAIRRHQIYFAHLLRFSPTESAAILRTLGIGHARQVGGARLRARAQAIERARVRGRTLARASVSGSKALSFADRTPPQLLNGCVIRPGATCAFGDLHGAVLRDAKLRGANLRRADLREATLTAADLTGANLRHADLRHANLAGADLTGANLIGARLAGAGFGVLGCGSTDPCPTPHLDAVAAALHDRNPDTESKVWWLSQKNTLPSKWLLQTPNCWGQKSCGKGPLPPSADAILSRMTNMVAGAEKSVDFAGLWPPPDGKFRDAIVDGLKQAVNAGHLPTVRFMLGTPPLQYSSSQFKSWFNDLIADVGANLPAQAAAMSTYRQAFVATSWNHSKVLAVDGRSAIVGGMNYWAGDYLQVDDPVDDVSMTVDGPAATDVMKFDDLLWSWVCANRTSSTYVGFFSNQISGCVSSAATLEPSTNGDVPILTVGRLGNGIDVPGEAGRESPAIPTAKVQGSACTRFQRQQSDTNTNPEYEYRNPGETALRALIASAQRSIFLSQQDLLGCVKNVEALFDERVFAALGKKILDKVPITIVVSNEGAKSNGGDYSNGNPMKQIAEILTEVVAAEEPSADARKLVCADVGLAGIRTVKANTWTNGSPFANHAKLVSVDDSAFYIGSENLYPARLQELGTITESPAAAATLKSTYLDPLWQQSRVKALIDPGNGVCDF